VNKLLYFRLALTNLRKNSRTYLPFFLAASMLTFTMYSFLSIAFNPGLSKVKGGMQFVTILDFGIFVVGLFTAIFLLYANSFLIKRRKKEMGLYAILGMEKKHIARVLCHEMSLTWLLSMVAGLGLGVLLTRLLFLLIRLAVRIDVPLVGTLNVTALLVTTALFAALFILLILINAWQVRIANPVELLRGGQVGEREPKARWILAVLGVAATGAGYWIAQSVTNPMAAIALFFVAVVLVILGTYLLFITGSIAILKLLKRNRHFYYRSKHFITVSGLLYRMKQNAAGLASIAILCTMAMITFGTTIALYNGTEKSIDAVYPYDLLINMQDAATQTQAQANNAEIAAQNGIAIRDESLFACYETEAYVKGGHLIAFDSESELSLNNYGDVQNLALMTEAQFAELEGITLDLKPGEIGCYTTAKTMTDTLEIGGTVYTLRRIASLPILPAYTSGTAFVTSYLIVQDEATAILIARATGESDPSPTYVLQCNLTGEETQLANYKTQLRTQLLSNGEYAYTFKSEIRQEWYTLYGGLLFLGIFLGLIFLMGTAVILYFKQISEGIQDHDRFIILQQVGMSPEEVRGTVRRQILMVFFLPLFVAGCHVAGSLHMMVLLLQLFGLMDVPYIALNTFLSALGIAVLYGIFYLRTVGVYYKQVKY
jgi:putative ABC transport system permease protein